MTRNASYSALFAVAIAAYIIASVAVMSAAAKGQGVWHHIEHIVGPYGNSSMATDAAGDVVVSLDATQSNEGFATVKYDANGHRLWRHAEKESGMAFYPIPVIGSAGDTYVCASHRNGYRLRLVKYSPTGERMWSYLVSYPAGGADLTSLIACPNGGVYVISHVFDDDYQNLTYIERVSQSGKLLWASSTLNSTPVTCELDSNGNLVVAEMGGTSYSYNLQLARYDPSGKMLTNVPVYFPSIKYPVVTGITIDLLGDTTIVGYGSESGPSNDVGIVARFGDDGSLLWSKTFLVPDALYTGFEFVTSDVNDDIIAAGFSDLPGEQAKRTIVKLNPGGNLLWLQRSVKKGTQDTDFTAIFADNSGRIIITANDFVKNVGTAAVVQWYSSGGSLLSEQDYTGSVLHYGMEEAQCAAFSPATNGLFVAGIANYSPQATGTEYDLFTIKYQD